MQLFGRRYDTGEPVQVSVEGGTIAGVEPFAAEPDRTARWPWIGPGLVDLQVNGYRGQEFSSAALTVEKVAAISRAMDPFGVIGYCPTLTTERFEVLEHALRTIAAACSGSPEVSRRVVGIHVEGPYISTEDGPRGAHPLEHCRRPDWDEFQQLQEAAEGRIRILTLSPEFDEAPEFIRRVVAIGVVVAIGHTAADADHIGRAVDAGASLSTHLGNGSHLMLHRLRNYIWDQLAEDRLTAGLIADGQHLPPAVVKTFIRAKTPKRCVLVSDLSGLAGLPPGRYPSGLCELEILPDGLMVIAGQRELLAGASRPIGLGVANVMRFAGVDLPVAMAMASTAPAQLVGAAAGGLAPGDPADLVLFHLKQAPDTADSERFAVQATVLRGEIVFGSP